MPTTVTTKTALLASPQSYPCVAVRPAVRSASSRRESRTGSSTARNSALPRGRGRNYWSLYGTPPTYRARTTRCTRSNDPRDRLRLHGSVRFVPGSGNAVLPIVELRHLLRARLGRERRRATTIPARMDPYSQRPAGDLAGNFITHVGNSATASGTEACVIGSFNPCVDSHDEVRRKTVVEIARNLFTTRRGSFFMGGAAAVLAGDRARSSICTRIATASTASSAPATRARREEPDPERNTGRHHRNKSPVPGRVSSEEATQAGALRTRPRSPAALPYRHLSGPAADGGVFAYAASGHSADEAHRQRPCDHATVDAFTG